MGWICGLKHNSDHKSFILGPWAVTEMTPGQGEAWGWMDPDTMESVSQPILEVQRTVQVLRWNVWFVCMACEETGWRGVCVELALRKRVTIFVSKNAHSRAHSSRSKRTTPTPTQPDTTP